MEGNITREFSARRAPPARPKFTPRPSRVVSSPSIPFRPGAARSRLETYARDGAKVSTALGWIPRVVEWRARGARAPTIPGSRDRVGGGFGKSERTTAPPTRAYARMGNQSETCHRKVTESCSDIPCFPNLTSCREIGSGYNSRIISRVLVFRFFHVHDASSSTFLLSSPPITPARSRARPPSLLRITSRHVTTFLPSTSRSRRLLTETCSVSTGGRGTKTRRNSSRRRSDPRSTAGKTNARRYPLAGISASACTTTASSACSSPSR